MHELQQLLGMQGRPAQSLAAAFVSLGLLEYKDSKFSNSAHASAFLVKQKPCYMGGFIRMVDERVYKT